MDSTAQNIAKNHINSTDSISVTDHIHVQTQAVVVSGSLHKGTVCFGAQVFENVPIQPRDAREASDVFYKQGQGDVSLNYENEVILTNETYGEGALPYVVPDNNVLVSGTVDHFATCSTCIQGGFGLVNSRALHLLVTSARSYT